MKFIEDSKFKTNTISIRFLAPLTEIDNEARILLPNMLLAATKQYPSKRSVKQYFETLYNTLVSGHSSKVGKLSVISFHFSFLNEKFVPHSLVSEVIEVLKEVLLNPYLIDGAFSNEILEQEKRMKLESLLSLEEDKITYSAELMKDAMFEGEAYQIHSYGTKEGIKAVSTKDIKAAYEALLKNVVHITVTGPKDDFTLLNDLPFVEVSKIDVVDTEWIPKETPKEVHVEREVAQANINIGYRTDIRQLHPLHSGMMLANLIFGSAPNSMLFETVRETHGLAYFVRSSYVGMKGAIYVSAGVDPKNIDQTISLIQAELEKLKNGDFSDALIKRAKETMRHELVTSFDRQGSISNMEFINDILNRKETTDEWITLIMNTTKEQIMEAAQSITLDTVHVLSKGGQTWAIR